MFAGALLRFVDLCCAGVPGRQKDEYMREKERDRQPVFEFSATEEEQSPLRKSARKEMNSWREYTSQLAGTACRFHPAAAIQRLRTRIGWRFDPGGPLT